MALPRPRSPWPLIMIVFLGLGLLFLIGRYRLVIDTDIVAALPQNDPVVADGRYVIAHHPIQERIVIDLGHRGSNLEFLISGGELVEKTLGESGLFKTVGLSQYEKLFPDLITHVTGHLPILFSEQDLQEQVGPLLTPENVRRTLTNTYSTLTGLEGIGQASLIARDPLDLRNIVLKRLSLLGSSQNVVMVKGQLLSADKKHLLIIAEPVTSGYDTAFSQKVTDLIENISRRLNRQFSGHDSFILTPVGAYRAALDNETAAKKDTQRAILVSTMVIALLLLLGFPRPWIGLLALLPAFGGTIAALFVYSLFQKSISILAVGFGGAIISFTVDYGIAYLLFLDRPYETRGIEVTKEVWSLGLLAMLTTAISFAFLFLAGFPALSQLGVVCRLGSRLHLYFRPRRLSLPLSEGIPGQAPRHPASAEAGRSIGPGREEDGLGRGSFRGGDAFFRQARFSGGPSILKYRKCTNPGGRKADPGRLGRCSQPGISGCRRWNHGRTPGERRPVGRLFRSGNGQRDCSPGLCPVHALSRGTTGQREFPGLADLLDQGAHQPAAAGDWINFAKTGFCPGGLCPFLGHP